MSNETGHSRVQFECAYSIWTRPCPNAFDRDVSKMKIGSKSAFVEVGGDKFKGKLLFWMSDSGVLHHIICNHSSRLLIPC